MPNSERPFTAAVYDRMAKELEVMVESIQQKPEMNDHFVERLALLAKQMREDQKRVYPDK